jgi:hypothetical protein
VSIGDEWDSRPRMLQELCDGHPGIMVEIYAYDCPSGVRLWLCRGCWMRTWHADGKPPQTAVR